MKGRNFVAIFLKRLRYAAKTSEKANCLISLGLLRPDLLALCTLGAQVKSCGVIRAEPKLG